MGNKEPFYQLFMTTFAVTARKDEEIQKEAASFENNPSKSASNSLMSCSSISNSSTSIVESNDSFADSPMHRVQAQRSQETNFVDKFINVFNIIKGGQLNIARYKTDRIEMSVTELIFRRKRYVKTKSCVNRKTVPFDINPPQDLKGLMEAINVFNAYSSSPSDYFDPNSLYKSIPVLHVTTLQQNLRQAFSFPQLLQVLS